MTPQHCSLVWVRSTKVVISSPPGIRYSLCSLVTWYITYKVLPAEHWFLPCEGRGLQLVVYEAPAEYGEDPHGEETAEQPALQSGHLQHHTAALHTLHCLVTRWRWQGPAEDGDLVRRTAPTTAVTTINTPMARVEMTRTGMMDTGDTRGLTDICSSVQVLMTFYADV